jgi:hypothetical protein
VLQAERIMLSFAHIVFVLVAKLVSVCRLVKPRPRCCPLDTLAVCRLADVLRLRIVDTTELVNSTALLRDLNDHSEFLEPDDADELKEQSKKAAQTKNTSEGYKQKWRLAASISLLILRVVFKSGM